MQRGCKAIPWFFGAILAAFVCSKNMRAAHSDGFQELQRIETIAREKTGRDIIVLERACDFAKKVIRNSCGKSLRLLSHMPSNHRKNAVVGPLVKDLFRLARSVYRVKNCAPLRRERAADCYRFIRSTLANQLRSLGLDLQEKNEEEAGSIITDKSMPTEESAQASLHNPEGSDIEDHDENENEIDRLLLPISSNTIDPTLLP